MSSDIEVLNADFMENQSENESLRVRIREVEDENQELRAQNLIQNRTIVELRNEMVLMRIQLTEMADTSALLRERVRNLTRNIQQSDGSVSQITVPPLMAPPPVPPPLPPARIRISPRQVGAGEALTTPLGVSLSSPPRHRIKRDCRQNFYRTRPPYRRFDSAEAGPSSTSTFLAPERPNYFVGLRIIPQFQTSFICSSNQSSGYSDSASDSSGSDENPQLIKRPKSKSSEGEPTFGTASPFSKDFEILRNVKNLHHHKVRQTILQNHNFSIPNTNSKFFFPLPWSTKSGENATLPSTSNFPDSSTSNEMSEDRNVPRNATKISDCIQYTFPTIHEGLHHSGIGGIVTSAGQPSRLRKLKKNIPYLRSDCFKKETEKEISKFVAEKNQKNLQMNTIGVDTTFLSSMNESERYRTGGLGEISDLEQDGFQGDESSNCMTSTENSLEKICISESKIEKKS